MMKGTAGTRVYQPTFNSNSHIIQNPNQYLISSHRPFEQPNPISPPLLKKKKKKGETEKSESHINRYTNIWGNIVVFAPDGRVWQLGRPS